MKSMFYLQFNIKKLLMYFKYFEITVWKNYKESGLTFSSRIAIKIENVKKKLAVKYLLYNGGIKTLNFFIRLIIGQGLHIFHY